jgi:beta-lactam-binding protein with PASTA domain
MSFNLMQGALAAVMLQQRNVTGNQLAAGAALAAVMPGMPGLLVPVLMTQKGTSPANGNGNGTVSVGTTVGSTSTFVKVPNVQGLPADLAKQTIEDVNLVAEIVPDRNPHASATQDAVYSQTPDANSYAEEQSTVELLVQVSPSVPSVQGLGVHKALELLKEAGLEATQLNVDAGGDQKLDTIVTQNPKPGQHASDGKVTLVVQRPDHASHTVQVAKK